MASFPCCPETSFDGVVKNATTAHNRRRNRTRYVITTTTAELWRRLWVPKPRRPAGATQQGPVVVYGNEPTRRGCSDGQSADLGDAPLPGWRAGVARAGGRSSWRTRCGCGDKHSFGPRRGSVKRLNGPTPGSRKPRPMGICSWVSNLTLWPEIEVDGPDEA